MSASNVKQLCESTREKLKLAIQQMEGFLNEYALPALVGAEDQELKPFYQGFLSDLRHVLVFSEVSYEALGVTLRRATFDVDFAEKALYEVYHRCVNSFYYPKNECYSEDGRYAYTGQDAIRFMKKPTKVARDIILELSKVYEELRDDLNFYESDYLTQRRLQNNK